MDGQETRRHIILFLILIFTQSVFDRLTRDTGATTYITTEFGLGLAVMAVLVAVLFWRRRDALPATV